MSRSIQSVGRRRIASIAILAVIALSSTIGISQPSEAATGEVGPPEWLPFRGPVNARGGCGLVPFGDPCPDIQVSYQAGAPSVPVHSAGKGQVTVIETANGCDYGSLTVTHEDGIEAFFDGLASVTVSDGQWVDETTQLATIVPVTPDCEGFSQAVVFGIRTDGQLDEPGPLVACHGGIQVVYPAAAQATTWGAIALNENLISDAIPCGAASASDGDGDGTTDAFDACIDAAGRVSAGGCPELFALANSAIAMGDFDGDGFDDALVGAPGETTSFAGGSARQPGRLEGIAHLTYGTANGLTDDGQQVLRQGYSGTPYSVGMVGGAEPGDLVGAAVTAGDFDGDGFDDAVIGAPGESIGSGAQQAGAVHVLYGSETGLTVERWFREDEAPRQRWIAQSNSSRFYALNLPGAAELDDYVGAALAAGDFNGDGFDDLAIGAPGEDIGTQDRDQGVVLVMFGSADGLTDDSVAVLRQRGFGGDGALIGTIEQADQVGASLAVGDVDGDGIDDLAIGAPGESIGSAGQSSGAAQAGAVHLVFGASDFREPFRQQVLRQGGLLAGTPEFLDRIGSTLALGDLNGDGFDDLAIGAPGEGIGSSEHAGIVHVVPGTAAGLTSTGQRVLGQGISLSTRNLVLRGRFEANDMVGTSLAIGDLDGDGIDDLAIGAPGEGVGSIDDAGIVHVLSGTVGGLDASTQRYAGQNSQITAPDIRLPGGYERDDVVGAGLATGDANGDGTADLVIAAPGEDLGDIDDTGIAQVYYGPAAPLGRTVHTLGQNIADEPGNVVLLGTNESGDRLGGVVSGRLLSPVADVVPSFPYD